MGDFSGLGSWLPDLGFAGFAALILIALLTGRLVTNSSMMKAYEALESRAKTAEQREQEAKARADQEVQEANARTEVALRVVEMQGKQLDIVVEQSGTMLSILQALPHASGGKRNGD